VPRGHCRVGCASGTAGFVERAPQVANLGVAALGTANERAVEHAEPLHARHNLVPRVRVHLDNRVTRQPRLNQRREAVKRIDR
jgi:hypothetical protein